MSTMQAVLIKDGKGPIENLYIGEAPKPILQKGQILVKASFNCLIICKVAADFKPLFVLG